MLEHVTGVESGADTELRAESYTAFRSEASIDAERCDCDLTSLSTSLPLTLQVYMRRDIDPTLFSFQRQAHFVRHQLQYTVAS